MVGKCGAIAMMMRQQNGVDRANAMLFQCICTGRSVDEQGVFACDQSVAGWHPRRTKNAGHHLFPVTRRLAVLCLLATDPDGGPEYTDAQNNRRATVSHDAISLLSP